MRDENYTTTCDVRLIQGICTAENLVLAGTRLKIRTFESTSKLEKYI
jgi:hypothetical protein